MPQQIFGTCHPHRAELQGRAQLLDTAQAGCSGQRRERGSPEPHTGPLPPSPAHVPPLLLAGCCKPSSLGFAGGLGMGRWGLMCCDPLVPEEELQAEPSRTAVAAQGGLVGHCGASPPGRPPPVGSIPLQGHRPGWPGQHPPCRPLEGPTPHRAGHWASSPGAGTRWVPRRYPKRLDGGTGGHDCSRCRSFLCTPGLREQSPALGPSRAPAAQPPLSLPVAELQAGGAGGRWGSCRGPSSCL